MRTRNSRGDILRAAIAASMVSSIATADAQESEPQAGLEEIIVTSRYRAENLQQTPLAISAFTGESLELRSLDNVEDLGAVIPNAFFTPNTSNFGPTNTVGLRNVIQTDFLYAFEPAVGVYIDDVYHGTLTGSAFDLMDLDRVEVLRGPQGTLFGKNSLGGAIRLFSKAPEGDNTGFVEATYGDFDRLDVKGVYDIALVPDRLALRVSGVSKHRDGYMRTLDFTCQMIANGTPQLAGINDGIVGWNDPDGPGPTSAVGTPIMGVVGSAADNAFAFPEERPAGQRDCQTGTMGGEDLQAGRIMLRWSPSDRFELGVAADRSDESTEALSDALLDGPAPSLFDTRYINQVILPAFGIRYDDDRFNSPDPYSSYSTWADPIKGTSWSRLQKHEAEGLSTTIDYGLTDNTHLKVVAAYRTYFTDWTGDSDETPIELNTTNNLQDHEQRTLEAQFSGTVFNGRLEWTAGLFYYDAFSKLGGRVVIQNLNFSNVIPVFDQNDTFGTENTSAFVHVVADLTDKLSLSGGVRRTEEDKVYTFDHTGYLTVSDPLLYGQSRNDWKLSLDYAINDNLFAYVSAATGFRSDGAQPRPFTPGQLQPVSGEEIENTEVGIKADLLDDRLRVNATLFYADYDPRLVSLAGARQCNLVSDPDPGPPFFGLPNSICPAGTAMAGLTGFNWIYYAATTGVSKGVELEISAFPIDNLAINYSLGLNEFVSSKDPSTLDYRHPTSLLQPRRNMSAGIQYDFNFANGGVLSPRLDWFYQSKRTNGPANIEQRGPDHFIEEYDTFNMRVTYQTASRDWSIALAATNVTDEFYWYQLSSLTGTNPVVPTTPRGGVPSRPREWSLSLRKSF